MFSLIVLTSTTMQLKLIPARAGLMCMALDSLVHFYYLYATLITFIITNTVELYTMMRIILLRMRTNTLRGRDEYPLHDIDLNMFALTVL